jgi:hypothetical protein
MNTKHIKLHAAENMVAWGIYLEDGTRLALVGGVSQLSKTLAKQFAAAPEMVEALRLVRDSGMRNAAWDAACAALAKAEGGAA